MRINNNDWREPMKKFSKIAMIGIMSIICLTGCGAPKVETLVDGMYDTKISSGKCEMSLDVDVAAKYDDEEISAKISADLNMDIQGVDDIENMSAAVTGNVTYDIMDGLYEDKYKNLEAYIVNDGDEQTIYFKNPKNEVYYYTTNISEEVGIELSEKDIQKIQDAAKELWYKAEVSKNTEVIGGEKCYVLTMTPSGEEYVQLMATVSKVMDMDDEWDEIVDELEDEYDISIADVLDNSNIQFTAYVSQKNKYMVGIVVDMSGVDVEGIFEVFEDAFEDMDVDPDDIEIEFNALSFSFIMSDINDTEVEVPKKIVKNSEEYIFGAIDSTIDYDEVDEEVADEEEDVKPSSSIETTVNDDGTVTTTYTISTAESKDYGEDDKEFVLHDLYGNEVYECSVPEGYYISFASGDNSFFILSDNTDEYDYSRGFIIDTLIPHDVVQYVNEGIEPSYLTNVTAEYQPIILDNGRGLVAVVFSYDLMNERRTDCYVLVDYEKSNGDVDFFYVQTKNEFYTDDYDSMITELSIILNQK